MSHAVHPGPQRTARIVVFKTAPKLKMGLLQEISPLVGVGLIGVSQTFKR